MQKLIPVEQARAIMIEAGDWSVWRWLTEKRRVRKAADAATEAFDRLEKAVKAAWSEDLKKAYRELELEESVNGDMPARKLYETAHTEAQEIDPRIKIVAQHVREADNEAYNARLDAEEIFDEAERRLSTSMARQGTRKALESWDLREKAIRKAEAAARHR